MNNYIENSLKVDDIYDYKNIRDIPGDLIRSRILRKAKMFIIQGVENGGQYNRLKEKIKYMKIIDSTLDEYSEDFPDVYYDRIINKIISCKINVNSINELKLTLLINNEEKIKEVIMI